MQKIVPIKCQELILCNKFGKSQITKISQSREVPRAEIIHLDALELKGWEYTPTKEC